MKVVIFGVGRSGTTAIYSLLQNIMRDIYGDGSIDFVYEPFLWDREIFDDLRENYGDKFKYLDSLSVDGLYWHQKLPMFIKDAQPYIKNPYIHELLSPEDGRSHLLMKSIRINGRFKLFDNIADRDTKFIFTIRNPVDVINSVINKFSFFGNNFHRSDEERFFKQVSEIYNIEHNTKDLKEVTKQVLYWKFMNKFFIDQIDYYVKKPLILVNEQYSKEPQNTIASICSYLKIENKHYYLDYIVKKVGVLTEKNFISYNDYIVLERYLDDYKEILEKYGCSYVIDKAKFHRKYIKVKDLNHLQLNKGYNANVLEKKNFHKDNIIGEKDIKIEQQREVIKRKDNKVKKMQVLIKRKDDQLDEIKMLIKQKDAKLDEIQMLIKQKDEQLDEKEKKLRLLYDSWTYKVGRALLKPLGILISMVYSIPASKKIRIGSNTQHEKNHK